MAITIRNGREHTGVWTDPPGRRFLSLLYRPEDDGICGVSLGFVHLPPETESSKHQHEEAHEFWIVLAGEGEVQIGDERAPIKQGDVIKAPPGLPHCLINSSTDTLFEAVYVLAPSGDERNVVEMLAKQGAQRLKDVGEERLAASEADVGAGRVRRGNAGQLMDEIRTLE